MTTTRTCLLTAMALLAFAANSVLCRLALSYDSIDPASFTLIRLASGALVLLLLAPPPGPIKITNHRTWQPALMLFGYAICFSFAYTSLATGTGALILFATVQLTILINRFFAGDKPGSNTCFGSLLAFGGLIYLVLPKISAPSATGAALMTIAGICWGTYCLSGHKTLNPLAETRLNFMLSLPLSCLAAMVYFQSLQITPAGVILAVASGGIASGIGYAIWYMALQRLSAHSAAILQLTVPVIAAVGGVTILAEELSLRIIIAATVILGGVALALRRRESISSS